MSEHSVGADHSAGLLRQGLERSTLWMHFTAAVTAFASDVLKPLLHYFTLGMLVTAAVCAAAIWLLVRIRAFKRETGAAIFAFFVVTTALTTAVYAAEAFSGDPGEGVAAHTFPELRQLQRALDIVDRRTQRIEANTNQIIGLLEGKQQPPTIIARHIGGTWGEGDCSAVSYRFAMTQGALVIESIKRPDGMAPYRFVGTIISAKDNALEVRGESPEAAKGLSATFRYEGNGVTERLHWQDRVQGGTDVELNRCG